MSENKQPPAVNWQGLMTAKEIVEAVRISRAHWHSLVKEGKAPPPAIRIPPRYTRWNAGEVKEWLASPTAWLAARSTSAQ
jgi:predicted DNA-binding transcriptional regulator AlpA